MNRLPNVGTIVSWDAPAEVSFGDLRNAVIVCGFDVKFAREMLPRSAFQRAAKELSEKRIIRRTAETDTAIMFQFTSEYLNDGVFEYTKECEMSVDKVSGVVNGDDYSLSCKAQQLLIEHQAKRNCSDITRMVQRIFQEHKGDLVPLRKAGGVYFVPVTHNDLVERVKQLLEKIGGKLNPILVQPGDADTNATVAESMAGHLEGLIDEFKQTCGGLDVETRPDVIERRASVIADLRNKLESYQGLLSGFSDSIKQSIDSAEIALAEALLGRKLSKEELSLATASV